MSIDSLLTINEINQGIPACTAQLAGAERQPSVSLRSSSGLFGQHRALSRLTLMCPDGDDEPSLLPRHRNGGGRFVSSVSFDLNVY